MSGWVNVLEQAAGATLAAVGVAISVLGLHGMHGKRASSSWRWYAYAFVWASGQALQLAAVMAAEEAVEECEKAEEEKRQSEEKGRRLRRELEGLREDSLRREERESLQTLAATVLEKEAAGAVCASESFQRSGLQVGGLAPHAVGELLPTLAARVGRTYRQSHH